MCESLITNSHATDDSFKGIFGQCDDGTRRFYKDIGPGCSKNSARTLFLISWTGSDKLADGYRVEVQIITWQGSEVIKIPVSAIFRSGENWAVFKVQNGMVRQCQTRSGIAGNLKSRSKQLNPGDIVITHPSADVKEATRVRAAE